MRNETNDLVAVPDDEALNALHVDPTDRDAIYDFLQGWKQQVLDCWTCQSCGFQFPVEHGDGNVTNYHFLEYSGT